ncbi:hypothetical protein BIW11_01531 [Tropilaelaps mercedesae]|uniref:Homeobox domain-containing protein n=1 Tax=Tropilaelaps mercedesae TaxID=418985 RepID=A0A1V9XCL1_9ACAR|nr:hypothetical protein BIW11_01531 [Tropilaelaps mercedesae]
MMDNSLAKRSRLMDIGAPSLGGGPGDASPPMSPLALTTSPAVDSDCSSSDNTTSGGGGTSGPGGNSHNQSPADRDKAAALAQQQRKKKARTTFTGRQIFELEKQFELKKYLSSSERAEMAKLLNVTETQAKKTLPSLRKGGFEVSFQDDAGRQWRGI